MHYEMISSMSYETLAALDVIANNKDVVGRIVEAANTGMSIDNIAEDMCTWVMEGRPKGTLELYDYLLEHAIEQIDFELIVKTVLQADEKTKQWDK